MFNIVVAMHSIRHNVEVMRKKDENVDARMDVARRVPRTCTANASRASSISASKSRPALRAHAMIDTLGVWRVVVKQSRNVM